MAKKNNNKTVVEIFGESYALKGDADIEYMKKTAKLVDDYMRKAAYQTRSFDNRKIAVLASLQLADDYLKLKKDYDELMALFDEK